MWNPFSGLNKKRKPFSHTSENFAQANNSFSIELENGVKLEVVEFPDMSGKEFVDYVKKNNPEINFLEAVVDTEFLLDATHNIAEKSLFVKDKGIYSLGMDPCSYVTFVAEDGVFLYHWFPLRGSDVTGTLKKFCKKI